MTGRALSFEVVARSRSTAARVGRVTTPSGGFDTPAFMPVGTRGSVKGLLPELVRLTGAQIVLNNTYHLLLRPGAETIARLGGVRRFMNWPGPILTDSGGYQAYSMADINAIDDDGVTFKSVVDGRSIRLTPEEATRVQNLLGSDIMMAFDDCPPPRAPEAGETDPRLTRARRRDAGLSTTDRLELGVRRSAAWLARCVTAHARPSEQALFGIVQGGTDLELRARSGAATTAIDLPGYAIGGVAVGESPEQIARVVRATAPLLPDDRPRYLMGVGYERDILAAVRAGVDMFDCVLPTRNGRNANAFTRGGQIRLRNAKYAEDPAPIENGCDCPACDPARHGWKTPGAGTPGGGFSRAYIRHLFMCGEMLGPILVSLHNLRHFQSFMGAIRTAIASDDWSALDGSWPV